MRQRAEEKEPAPDWSADPNRYASPTHIQPILLVNPTSRDFVLIWRFKKPLYASITALTRLAAVEHLQEQRQGQGRGIQNGINIGCILWMNHIHGAWLGS